MWEFPGPKVAKRKTRKRCPMCGEPLHPMDFMGAVPDGYSCAKCCVYLDDRLDVLARVY